MATAVRLGIVGTGSFGRFCLEQYLTVPEVEVVAVADADPSSARQVAAAHGLQAVSVDELLDRTDLDMVYLGTPPGTHAELATRALRAGRHVLCEKPLALGLADARGAVDLARRQSRQLVVNLVMRHDPLCVAVRSIIDEGLLGQPLHAFFENYANDEHLPPEHWFWDRRQSGGIFVEHGVHFFDLFAMWFGPGVVTSAQQVVRPGTEDLIDQVACSATFGDAVHATFYHGFHQPSRMDRQEFGIVCELGSIRMTEWIPATIEIDCLADSATLDALLSVVPNATCSTLRSYVGDERGLTARHQRHEVDGRYLVVGDAGAAKMGLYAQAVRDLLVDQVVGLSDPRHRRLVTEANGVDSLAMAVTADQLART